MKCFTCRNGIVTPGIKVERASIAGGTKEIDAIPVGSRYKGGTSALVSVSDRGVPQSRILTNAINIITRSGKHGLSPTSITERDTTSGAIVLFEQTPPVGGGDTSYFGECIKEVDGDLKEWHFIPFPGTVLSRGTAVREDFGKPRGVAEQMLAVLQRGQVASISITEHKAPVPAWFIMFDGKEVYSMTLSARKELPPSHPMSKEKCKHFLALNREEQ